MKTLLPFTMLLASPALAADPTTGTRLEISVVGHVAQPPDVATIGAGVVSQASTAGQAMADNARAMTATGAALRRAGVADRDLQTAAINLAPQYRYVDNRPPALTGYQASNRVSVRLRDLGRAGAVFDALVAAGANQIDGPTFSIDHPDTALDQARTQALAAARARADLYARAAGLRVTRIVMIHEEENGPPVVRPMMAMAMKRAETPVESGEQDVSVTLSVTFELG